MPSLRPIAILVEALSSFNPREGTGRGQCPFRPAASRTIDRMEVNGGVLLVVAALVAVFFAGPGECK